MYKIIYSKAISSSFKIIVMNMKKSSFLAAFFISRLHLNHLNMSYILLMFTIYVEANNAVYCCCKQIRTLTNFIFLIFYTKILCLFLIILITYYNYNRLINNGRTVVLLEPHKAETSSLK